MDEALEVMEFQDTRMMHEDQKKVPGKQAAWARFRDDYDAAVKAARKKEPADPAAPKPKAKAKALAARPFVDAKFQHDVAKSSRATQGPSCGG